MSLRQRFEAIGDLLRHYREVFGHFWKIRKTLGGGVFHQNEAEFLPSALSLQKTPVSPASRLVAWTLMLFVALAVVWSVLGHVDIVVNATGKIVPDARIKTIASVYTASVRALHVEEGQTVTAGEVLIELDASAFDADRDKAMGDEDMDMLQAARSKAFIEAVDSLEPPVLPKLDGVPEDRWKSAQDHLTGQYNEFRANLERIDGNIGRYTESLKLAAKTAADYKALASTHDVSGQDYDDKEQVKVEAERQLDDAKNERSALLAETKRMAFDTLSDGVKTAASSQQDAAKAESQSRLLVLTAPVDGTVQQLTVHTVGGVVSAAQPLMSIVPKDTALEVEAFMQDRDVGFVREGQAAEVKIDAFDYTKYGTIPATVAHVSRDAIQDEKRGLLYSTIVSLSRSTIFVDGREQKLGPGMSVSVAIKTGRRRLIEYVLSPLIRHERESLNER
jgi:hemolysin D